MRKICVVVGSRANYGSIKSVMRAVRAHPDLQLQIIVGASALLDRFGSVVDVIERGAALRESTASWFGRNADNLALSKSARTLAQRYAEAA